MDYGSFHPASWSGNGQHDPKVVTLRTIQNLRQWATKALDATSSSLRLEHENGKTVAYLRFIGPELDFTIEAKALHAMSNEPKPASRLQEAAGVLAYCKRLPTAASADTMPKISPARVGLKRRAS